MAAIMPGLLLAALYAGYIMVRSSLNPTMAPPLSAEEASVALGYKLRKLLVSLLPPGFLVLAVMGSIFFGLAPPTEAAAMGAVGAIILAIVYRSLSWQNLKRVVVSTMRASAFVYIIGAMAYAFVGVFMANGGGQVISNLIMGTPGGRWGAFAIIMFICFILGFFVEWLAIVFIVVPLVTPLVPLLGFDPLWFALMICVNIQASFLTPPMATAIYICRGTAPEELGITMGDIVGGIWPFVVLVLVGLVLCTAFPSIILWLPNQMGPAGW